MTSTSRKQKWTKTVQFFAAYLVAAWTFLQFVDWILNRYGISPNWVDLLLWFFIGIIPSLLIYLYNQERINQGIVKLWEKIFIPINVLLLAVVLYFGFGNSDLGATTKEISFTNDEGNVESRTITKEEFRIGLPIFEFEQKTQDTSFVWLEEGIQELLYQDLLQDKNISPYTSDSEGTVFRVSESRIFNDYYLDGFYEVVDSVYKITPTLRNAKNGDILKQQTFEGKDLLDLLDEISVFAKNNVGITENKRNFYIDLNLKEYYSNSLEAIKQNLKNNYAKAQEIDSTFAISYFENAYRNIRFSIGSESEREKIDMALKYSSKLPLQMQLQVRILGHMAYEDWETAEKLLKLQLEIDPSNDVYNRLLYAVYGETKQASAFLKHANARYERDKSIDNGTNMLHAALVGGKYDAIITAIRGLEIVQPNNPDLFSFKLRPQLFKGELEAAKKTQERTKLTNPNWENFTSAYDSVIAYLSENKPSREKLEQFVGRYRSQYGEQTYDFWMEEDRLLTYVSNQRIYAPILAGDHKVVFGGYINKNANEVELLFDGNGKVYGTKNTYYSFGDPQIYAYWVYDELIESAEEALKEGNLEKAKTLYEKAIKEHPEHVFLKLALEHITFINTTPSEDLNTIYDKIIGNYGERKFWIKDDGLIYERKGGAKLRLHPIAENRFISVSRYGTIYAFEPDESGRLASVVYDYNNNTRTWEKLTEFDNYFLKDD